MTRDSTAIADRITMRAGPFAHCRRVPRTTATAPSLRPGCLAGRLRRCAGSTTRSQPPTCSGQLIEVGLAQVEFVAGGAVVHSNRRHGLGAVTVKIAGKHDPCCLGHDSSLQRHSSNQPLTRNPKQPRSGPSPFALDAGVPLRDVQKPPATPTPAPPCATTGREFRSTDTPTYIVATFLAGASRDPVPAPARASAQSGHYGPCHAGDLSHHCGGCGARVLLRSKKRFQRSSGRCRRAVGTVCGPTPQMRAVTLSLQLSVRESRLRDVAWCGR